MNKNVKIKNIIDIDRSLSGKRKIVKYLKNLDLKLSETAK